MDVLSRQVDWRIIQDYSEADLVTDATSGAAEEVCGVDAELAQQAGVLVGVDLVWLSASMRGAL